MGAHGAQDAVRDLEHAHAIRDEIVHERVDALRGGSVEHGRRLIEHEVGGVERKGGCEAHELLLAAGELGGGAVLELPDAAALERSQRTPRNLLGRQAEVAQAEGDLVEDERAHHARARVLGHEAHVACHGDGGLRREDRAIDDDLPRRREAHARDELGERRFAAGVGTEHADVFAGFEHKRDVLESMDVAAIVEIARVPDPDHPASFPAHTNSLDDCDIRTSRFEGRFSCGAVVLQRFSKRTGPHDGALCDAS